MLACAVLAVIELPVLEMTTTSNYDVYELKDGHDATGLAAMAGATVEERFGLWAELRDRAAGVVVVQPSSVDDLTENARGLGAADDVVVADYDPAIDEATAAALVALASVTGVNRELRGEYALTLGAAPRTLVVVRGAGTWVLADADVLGELGVTPTSLGIDDGVLATVGSA